MEAKLVKLTIPPGMFKNGTKYETAGRWYDGRLVRFFEGTIRPVGGWTPQVDQNGVNLAAITGIARAGLAWRGADGSSLQGIGTIHASTSKLYVISGGALNDITPSGLGAGKVDAGGSVPGAFGVGAFGQGLFGTGTSVSQPVDPDTWTLDVFGAWLVGVCTATTSLYVWQGNTGTPAAVPTWGPVFTGSLVTSGSSTGTTIALTASTLTGTIIAGQTFIVSGVTYTAQLNAAASGNVLTVTVAPTIVGTISNGTAVTGTTAQAPLCTSVVVTPEHFVVALGAFDSSLGTLNSRLVAWASQATTSVWGPLGVNSAGNFALTTNGRIMSGCRTKVETLIFTDADLWRMTFLNNSLDYGFSQAGDQCGIIAPNAHATVDSAVYWMGRKGFYKYDGYVHPVPCDVADFIFGNINDLQRAKTWAIPIPQFGEVWWWYASNASTEVDSYVIYNYWENHWSTGSLPSAYGGRTAGAPAGPIQFPMMVSSLGVIWQHESGTLHSISPGAIGTILGQFLESGPVEVGYPVAPYGSAGDNVATILRIVPDEATLGDCLMQVAASLFPTDSYTYGPVLAIGQPANVRLKGRLLRVKFTASQGALSDWRIGTVRLGVKLGGKR